MRARRLLLAKASAAGARARRALIAYATAAIDGGIAALQQLRQRAGGAEKTGERRERDRGRPGKRPTAARSPGEPRVEKAIAPKPRRRLRSLLVYLSVMLAGGMFGMALAYDLLAQLLDRRSVEISRQEVKLSKYSKSLAKLRKLVDRQQAKQVKAETRLAASLAENERKLGEMEAKRTDAETRQASAISAVEAKRLEAEARLASAIAARSINTPRQQDTASGRSDERNGRAAPAKSGDCTVGGGDVRSVLKRCIADMNRN